MLLGKNLQITGVVDWEFTYAAPVEFSYAPPWWLLIEKPECWPNSIEDWEGLFELCLKTFIRAMKSLENAEIQQERLKEGQRLSGPMQAS
ncbi:Aminoglycoside phosphotransferase [Penicillium angulare]|uniref:Aminoglycoside phosphotransferase n=1 Tax=Penicillium angulare TaxID=116970 RepID=UPI0025426399|nr:Aminoglycoside phosphotransferase [Penicillium angulare]KAJ5259572.1 Aminoglycoside phosphotransferase [Penicillium angulare]